jgi:hypothetical protein
MEEIGFAIDQRKEVIPVLYEPCDVPIRMHRFQHIDFTRDYASALERCKSALGVVSAGAAPTPKASADEQIQAPRQWDADVIRRAEQSLTLHVGPIAKKLVQAAALNARTPAELYRLLADRIGNADDRAAFLKDAPPEPGEAGEESAAASAPSSTPDALPGGAAAFTPSLLDAVVRELTTYVGPISRHVVEQASREARGREDLFLRVSSRIADADERAAMLKRLRDLP